MRRRLSAGDRATLAGVALPAERPADTCVVAAPGGWSAAWLLDGLHKEPIGPAFRDPIDAAEASAFLRELHGLGA